MDSNLLIRTYEAKARRFEQLFNELPIAAFATDLSGNVFEWNAAAARLFERDPESMLTTNAVGTLLKASDQSAAWHLLGDVVRGTATQPCDCRFLKATGEAFPGRVTLIPMCLQSETVTGAIWTVLDMTLDERARMVIVEEAQRLAEATKALQGAAYTDALTGLPNHRCLQETLQREMRLALFRGEPMCLAMADIDHFKSFNDTFGHQSGDEVLAAFGAVLRETARDSDFVARYGGEEFAVILRNTDGSKALKVIERVRKAVEKMPSKYGNITASFGVAGACHDVLNPAHLIRRADLSLYAAKESGRNQTKKWCDLEIRVEEGISPEQWLHYIEVARVDPTGHADERMIQQAIFDHLQWKNRLRAHLLGEKKLDQKSLVSHHACRLGLWYDSLGKERFGQLPDFLAMDLPHEELHQIAAKIVELHESGHTDEAWLLLKDMEERSVLIVGSLESLIEVVRSGTGVKIAA